MGRAASVIALATTVVLLVVGPAGADELRWKPCFKIQCAHLKVPLDRAAPAAGSVSLAIQRRQARQGPRRGVTLLLAGGPGQAAIPAYSGIIDLGGLIFPPSKPYGDFARLTPRNDVVVYDQRGTGGSGLLRCRDLEASGGLDPGRAAESCATLLGPRRAHYTTSDSVDDIEALRQALGGPKLTLIGVSYGSYVAERYAIRYPQGVERMVLDSVVDPTGVDGLYRDTFAGVKRVLGRYCVRGCRYTHDPVADLDALVRRLGQERMRGTVGLTDGRQRPAEITREALLYSFISGDLEPALRYDFPAAVVSALHGDVAPLLRVQRRGLSGESIGDAKEFSTAVYAATSCEEAPLPYPRATPLGPRTALALQAALTAGPVFAPFDAFTAAHNDLLRLCRRWPTTSPGPTIEPRPLPDVPTLLLEGGQDTRTPVETAQRLVGTLPHGKLVVAATSGHSVYGAGGCPDRAVKRFLQGRPVPRGCPAPHGFAPDVAPRAAPRALSDVPPGLGMRGTPGRAVAAALATANDALVEASLSLSADPLGAVLQGSVRGAGLRSGRFSLSVTRHVDLTLHGAEYVPGLRVSGVLRRAFRARPEGRLRISGSRRVRGIVRVHRRTVSGRIGGQRFHFVVPGVNGQRIEVTDAAAPPSGGAAIPADGPRLLRDALAHARAPRPAFRDRTPVGLPGK